jgi:hypothetical protein
MSRPVYSYLFTVNSLAPGAAATETRDPGRGVDA